MSKKRWPVTFGTVAVFIARKNTGACYISALSCHTASCHAQQCRKQDQKYKTKTKAARPRPRPVWDRSCHKTVVSDPKTGIIGGVSDKVLACAFVAGLPEAVRQLLRASSWMDMLTLEQILARARAIMSDDCNVVAVANTMTTATRHSVGWSKKIGLKFSLSHPLKLFHLLTKKVCQISL